MSKYNTFVENGNVFTPVKVESTSSSLPSGTYEAYYDEDWDRLAFKKMELNCDKLIDIPSKEYDYVLGSMKSFLRPETKEKFTKEGFVYKRSVLLYGKPGTGKTALVQRICREALSRGAVVLFNPDPIYLTKMFEALNETDKDRLTLVIFEEFDTMLGGGSREEALLSILDGEVQKNNVMYLATTNYLDRIPLRMQRPGRFSSIVEVGFPDDRARWYYLKLKGITEDKLLKTWTDKTKGFSIDELKETVLAVKCLDENLTDVINRVNELKERGLEAESVRSDNVLTEAKSAMNLLEGILSSQKAMGRAIMPVRKASYKGN